MFPLNICNGFDMPAGNAYPSGDLAMSPFKGTCSCSNCCDQFSRTFSFIYRLFIFNIPRYFLVFPLPCGAGSTVLREGFDSSVTLEIVIQEVLWSIWGSYSAIWSIPLTNVKWHSDPWPTLTSQPIRLSTNFMTLIPSLTFTDYEWFPRSICNGCGMPAGNAYPSGHLVPSPILGLANAPIVETKFLDLLI